MKEYDNTNKGALFLADRVTQSGDQYYNGTINIEGKEYKITMFINVSDNKKAPKFRISVNIPTEDKPIATKINPVEEDKFNGAFADFGDSIEIADDEILELPF